ncbi:UDP-N-acetylglucosamine 2-epimerase [Magnetospira sp. QH-2]|uniref:UDP-N-acetylglucosamine 2-epimerase n=1 Tax=Magnetospira sp. (strain QH-2) TaxID=1288970 RepID=UPI0003E811F9|nr:UDP-N-acetylglucosamine 2-epimerase [Magnetospira sp. QH-2]CCQ72688.1 UDP-N-acetylglucosamine 2-epimerase [Magnetospira sp. QH-2]
MRRIGVVTTSRADYGLLRPVLDAMGQDSAIAPALFVSGSHLSEAHGHTVDDIQRDGYPILERISCLGDGDGPLQTTEAMGRAVAGMGKALERNRPDLLLVLGDRFEMFACASAAVPFRVPIAHIHGGELTYGAMDEVFRHGLTKMSHLHFPATEAFAARLRQMGEEDWRITVSGAPGLDRLLTGRAATADDIAERFGIRPASPPLLVTLHPETLGALPPALQAKTLVGALRELDWPTVITTGSADPGAAEMATILADFASGREDCWVVDHLGSENYLGLMKSAAAVVGNSSSGIIEAASFGLPVVNVGDRQKGRTRAANVIDVPYHTGRIADAILKAVSPGFRDGLADLGNPYGDGHAADRIVTRLRDEPLGASLLIKEFIDLENPE